MRKIDDKGSQGPDSSCIQRDPEAKGQRLCGSDTDRDSVQNASRGMLG